MSQILLVVQILVAVSLIAIILLQQGKGADAGAAFGSGGAGTIFGARGPATMLTRITTALALVFFVNSIGLSYLAGRSLDRRSVVERFEEGAPVPGLPAQPDLPGAPQDVPSVPVLGTDLPSEPPAGTD